jgi:Fe-S cluster biogenesis protein NfuA
MTEEDVKLALDEVRPGLQADGGDVEFVALEGKTVKVTLTGACRGCPMSQMTLKRGIEAFLKERLPEIESVESA